MGFVIVIALGLYVLISIGVVTWASNHAKKQGKSAKRWGWGAALGMYLLVFWDWIPTVAVHQYYCAMESGFWVYKTSEQWKKENLGVMETLVDDKNGSFTRVGDEENHTDKKVLNQRFFWRNEKHRIILFLPVYRWKFEMVDSQDGNILGRRVDFSTGKGLDYLKFWMNNESCSSSYSESIKASEFTNQFKGATK